MAQGLPPSLPFMNLEVAPRLMTAFIQRRCLHGGHSPGPFTLTSERGISHPCSREGEDQTRRPEEGCCKCQHKQLLLCSHCEPLSSMLSILCVTETDFHPQKKHIRVVPRFPGCWAKPIHTKTNRSCCGAGYSVRCRLGDQKGCVQCCSSLGSCVRVRALRLIPSLGFLLQNQDEEHHLSPCCRSDGSMKYVLQKAEHCARHKLSTE